MLSERYDTIYNIWLVPTTFQSIRFVFLFSYHIIFICKEIQSTAPFIDTFTKQLPIHHQPTIPVHFYNNS